MGFFRVMTLTMAILLCYCDLVIADESTQHAISCPQKVAYIIDKTVYKDWNVYTHDSIKLESADIYIKEPGFVEKYVDTEEHDGETLLPDHIDRVPRDPKTNGEVSTSFWNLGSALQRIKLAAGYSLMLVCDYVDGTTELSMPIPAKVTACKLTDYEIDPVDFHGRKIEMTCY